MKKLILLFSVFTYSFSLYSQASAEVDSTAVAFKAKLFTVSEYGLASKEQILEDIEGQQLVFLKTKYRNFLFIKILFSQPYRKPPHNISTLNRDCYFYLAYNKIDSKFYRLGGFDNLDLDIFFKDLELKYESFFQSIQDDEIEEISISCLYEYFMLSEKQRIKKGFKCFKNCSENTTTFFIDR